jgi:hypothetical protein
MTTIDFHFNETSNRLKQNSTIIGKPYYREGISAGECVFIAQSDYRGINILLPANKIKVKGIICLYLNDKILGQFNISKLSSSTTAFPDKSVNIKDQIRMELKCNNFAGDGIFRVQLQFIDG